MSMETMVEELVGRFKPLTEEELYRIVQTLLFECFQQSNSRLGKNFKNLKKKKKKKKI